MEIKILGMGCPTCEKTAKIVEEAVQEAGINAKIEKLMTYNKWPVLECLPLLEL